MRCVALLLVLGCSSSTTSSTPKRVEAPTPATPPIAKPTPPTLRLPATVKPTSYALDLTIVPDLDRVKGRITIAANVEVPTRVVWLSAAELTVDKATIGGVPAQVVQSTDYLGLVTERDVTGSTTIEITYSVAIDREKSRGIYAEKEGADNYVYTFFEPTDARRAFPCFDEPSYKVPWQLTFHVKKEHVALANAPVVRETDEANGMKRVELAPSKPMPSYLVAFVVGPFELVDGGTAGRAKTPLRFIIPKGRAAELGYAKQSTPKVVAALESYFDMDYPFEKLDVAVVPRFWGTMEHPGIVAMGQPLTLIRPGEETRARKQSYTNILAHELAHYWFGDYVTMAWWDDTWLNEALAQWMDVAITDTAEPTWRFRDRRIFNSLSAMASDEALTTRAMERPVTTPEDIEASFDNAITYDKGASILRMFEAAVTPEKFRGFIRSYIRAHAWGIASSDDLLREIKAQLGPETERAFRTFIEQPGVPLIAGKLVCENKRAKLVLTQSRALPKGVVDKTARTWRLPVCVRWGDKPAQRACTALDWTGGELDLGAGCPTWVILNADATGYYRSTVDIAMAKKLLAGKSATAIEKMMLVADLRAAVARDEIAIDALLELVPLIAADADERVAQFAFAAASVDSEAFDDALYAKWKQYLTRTFLPTAKRLGWLRKPQDNDERHELRRSVVGTVALQDAGLKRQASVLAERWLTDKKAIDDDMVGSMLAVASREADQAWFDKLVAAVKTARDRREKQQMIGALGMFKNPEIAKQALALMLAKDWDLRETSGIVFGALYTRETKLVARAFVKENLDKLLARMRDDEAAGFLSGLVGSCEPQQLAEMRALVEPRAKKFGGAENYVKRAVEQAEQCIAEHQRQLPALRRFLER
jgi:aminopeptidase N